MRPFEHVVREHGEVVLRVCRALLPAADADDAWSDTFLAAMRAYPRLRPDSNVRGWLVTIAHRKALDQLRAGRRRPLPSVDVPERAVSGGPELPDDALRAAVAALPAKQRAAVVLHHVAGLPYAAVAAEIGGTESAARRSAADGIARLRATYDRDSGG